MSPLAAKRMTMIWIATSVVVFVVLVSLGLVMRLSQAGSLDLRPDRFYAVMTLHGLGMAGTLFMGGLAAVWYRSRRWVQPSLGLMGAVYGLVLLGTLGLLAATLLGRFGAGWYMLYPLPFLPGAWPRWSVGVAVVSLLVLGTAWLLAQLDLLRALAARYGIRRLLAWDYLGGERSGEDLPPFVLITTVSLIAGSLTTVVGAVLLLLYLFQWVAPDLRFDPLALKNMVFLFGHTLVNITMYLGLALVYESLPHYSGRPWKTNRIVALSWNATLALVLLAFFHHLYMDFAQPRALQVLGQLASYLSAVPATVVTIFGAVGQVYRSGMRWRFTPLAFWTGLAGWVIGGFAAVIDSTIAINRFFHNTLWVPAHFHTYFLLGFVLILLGAFYEVIEADAESRAKLSLGCLLAGGSGFVAMFYASGVAGVPRRFATYTAIPMTSVAEAGQRQAAIAVYCVALVLLGLLLYAAALLPRWRQSWASA